MSTADVPDWTNPITEISGGALTDDYPDWTQAVIDTGGGGGGVYASLTGAGETTTPGDLTQAGGFTVNEAGSTGIVLSDAGSGGVTINDSGAAGALMEATRTTVGATGVTISSTTPPNAFTPGILIDDIGGGGVTLESASPPLTSSSEVSISAVSLIFRSTTALGFTELGGPTGTSVQIGSNNQQLGFLGATPFTKPAITGSRGGNVALQSLLIALNTYGLITDSTTP